VTADRGGLVMHSGDGVWLGSLARGRMGLVRGGSSGSPKGCHSGKTCAVVGLSGWGCVEVYFVSLVLTVGGIRKDTLRGVGCGDGS
jgi:hypothetical protein